MDKFMKKINQYIGTSKHVRFVLFIATLVVFVTTYSLILPAITISKEAAEEEAGIILENASEETEEMTDEIPAQEESIIEEETVIEEENVEEIPEEPEVTEYDENVVEETKEEVISAEEPAAEIQQEMPEEKEEVFVDEVKYEEEKDYAFVLNSSFSENAEIELKEIEKDEWADMQEFMFLV